MGDNKVLSDILLFKQLDEASKQPTTRGEDDRVAEGKKKKMIIVKKNIVQDTPLLPGK